MKFYNTLLALCLLQETGAFSVQGPKTPTTALRSSYLSGLVGGEDSPDNVQFSDAQGSGSASFADTSSVSQMTNAGGNYNSPNATQTAEMQFTRSIWDTLSPVKVQGGSLRTWSFSTPSIERVQVLLKTEGRPLSANVELWQGPDNSPQKMGIYIEDGDLRPFSAVIETPRGQNAIAIRNTGHLEFPLEACVEAEVTDAEGNGSAGLQEVTKRLTEMGARKIVQGGAIQTYPFAPSVASVQVSLTTDGRPLNARIELLQGPNNNKQVLEIYTEDGRERPLFIVLETPGVGNVVRIVNTATVEFPLTASVEPYLVEPGGGEDFAQGSWDSGSGTDFFIMDR